MNVTDNGLNEVETWLKGEVRKYRIDGTIRLVPLARNLDGSCSHLGRRHILSYYKKGLK